MQINFKDKSMSFDAPVTVYDAAAAAELVTRAHIAAHVNGKTFAGLGMIALCTPLTFTFPRHSSTLVPIYLFVCLLLSLLPFHAQSVVQSFLCTHPFCYSHVHHHSPTHSLDKYTRFIPHVLSVIDMNKGCIGDMKELGILEPLKLKRHVLVAAAEAAEAILRVDQIVQCAPRQRE